ncbi:MAG: hypothetical protein J6T26_03625, partial [Firmicutes bacterium]|nr:hypothetical protein [Bacillota bacterium]
MSSKLHAKIKLNGYLQTAADSGYTSARCHILGATAAATAATAAKKHQYGMYMQMTRARTSDHYADFGEVFFCFGQTEISLGTPSEPITYEIDVDPGAGTAVINGTTYSITLDSTVANDPCPLHAYGGGVRLTTASNAVVHDWAGHTCQMEMNEYVISSSAGVQLSSYVMVFNAFTEYYHCFDLITKTIGSNTKANLNIYDEDLIPYDAAEYGDFPLFVNQTAFQADVLAGLSYANGVDTLSVYGWLPVCSKREALHQLLLAMGVIIEKNADGNILFTIVTDNLAGEVDSDAVYSEGSEEQLEHTNYIELTEHTFSYDSSSTAEVVFESTAGSSGDYYIALFGSAPVYGTPTATGLTRYYSNCNAAVVSGTGTLSAKLYKHEETVLRRTLASYPDGRTVSVKDATLVTLQNSERVMDRLAAYYGGSVYKVNVGIVQNGESCGLKYNLLSAFGEAISGFLVRASKVATSIIKATCQVVAGYVPPAYDAGYSNYVILTGEGTWDVPDEVFEKQTPRIRVVLIGGGQGGTSGYA